MKLAEALILRADCQKRIAQLKSRLLTNAKVQEGDKPAETPQELIAELGRVSTELLNLIKRINRTSSATAFDGGRWELKSYHPICACLGLFLFHLSPASEPTARHLNPTVSFANSARISTVY